jgi:hypothetical protein
VYLLFRYLKQRHWLDLFLIVSIPIDDASILSLAFPAENPSSIAPQRLSAGVPDHWISLDGLLTVIETHFPPDEEGSFLGTRNTAAINSYWAKLRLGIYAISTRL